MNGRTINKGSGLGLCTSCMEVSQYYLRKRLVEKFQKVNLETCESKQIRINEQNLHKKKPCYDKDHKQLLKGQKTSKDKRHQRIWDRDAQC